jgi:hypothetical protein
MEWQVIFKFILKGHHHRMAILNSMNSSIILQVNVTLDGFRFSNLTKESHMLLDFFLYQEREVTVRNNIIRIDAVL